MRLRILHLNFTYSEHHCIFSEQKIVFHVSSLCKSKIGKATKGKLTINVNVYFNRPKQNLKKMKKINRTIIILIINKLQSIIHISTSCLHGIPESLTAQSSPGPPCDWQARWFRRDSASLRRPGQQTFEDIGKSPASRRKQDDSPRWAQAGVLNKQAGEGSSCSQGGRPG